MSSWVILLIRSGAVLAVLSLWMMSAVTGAQTPRPADDGGAPSLGFYVAIDGVQHGPLSRAALIEMIRAGTLKGDTPIWRQGLDRWRRAGGVAVVAILIDEHTPAAAPEPPPFPEFHLLIDGQQLGPLKEHELRNLIRDGRMTPETKVWRRGMEEWQKAGTLDELLPLLADGPVGDKPVGAIRVRAYCGAKDRDGIGTADDFVAARAAAIKACVASGGTLACCGGDIALER